MPTCLTTRYASKALLKLYKIITSAGGDNPANIMPPWLEEKVAQEFAGQDVPDAGVFNCSVCWTRP